MTGFKYRAFLSYSHADAAVVKRVHGRLEGFPIDKDIVGRETPLGAIPKTLRPIFRDRNDFDAGASLGEQTLAALDDAAAFIVLASPRSAGSHYVRKFASSNSVIQIARSFHSSLMAHPTAGRMNVSLRRCGLWLARMESSQTIRRMCWPPTCAKRATGSTSRLPRWLHG